MISYIFKFLFNLEDPLSGFKAYKIKKLKKVFKEIKDDFYLVDIIKLFLKKKYKVENIKINSKELVNRNPKIGSNFMASIKIMKCIKLLLV